MKYTQFYNSVRIVSTSTSLNAVQDYFPEVEKVLIVCSQGGKRRGYVNLIETALRNGRNRAPKFICYDNVEPNPALNALIQYSNSALSEKPDIIVAIGGGSVLDTGKILSVLLANPEKIAFLKEMLRSNVPQDWPSSIPLFAIPTTAGTGAEVTPFATIWDTEIKTKYSVQGTAVFPKVAFLDPGLTLSLPPRDTLYTALDTISHAAESLWNINRNPFTVSLSIEALELSTKSLPALIDFETRKFRPLTEKEIIELRTDLLNASALAGMAISHTRTALAHAISYPLTLEFDIPHGLACSFTLPKLVERNKKLLIELTRREELIDALQVLLNEIPFHSELERYAPRTAILNLVTEQNLKLDRLGNFDGIYGETPIVILSESLV